jgi:hypothetical protein
MSIPTMFMEPPPLILKFLGGGMKSVVVGCRCSVSARSTSAVVPLSLSTGTQREEEEEGGVVVFAVQHERKIDTYSRLEYRIAMWLWMLLSTKQEYLVLLVDC